MPASKSGQRIFQKTLRIHETSAMAGSALCFRDSKSLGFHVAQLFATEYAPIDRCMYMHWLCLDMDGILRSGRFSFLAALGPKKGGRPGEMQLDCERSEK